MAQCTMSVARKQYLGARRKQLRHVNTEADVAVYL